MKSRRVLRVAWRGITDNKLRTFLMMLGVIIGVAALTVVQSVGAGTRAVLAGRVNQMFANAPVMVAAKQPGAGFVHHGGMAVDVAPPTLTLEDARAILEQAPNVAVIGPVQMKGNVPLKYRDRSSSAMVFGVTPEWQHLRNYGVTEGEFLTAQDLESSARVCVLGQTVLRELFPDGLPPDATIRIDSVPFRVKGVLSAKGTSPMGTDFDRRLAIPLTTFSRRLYNVDQLSQVVLGLKHPRQMKQTAAEVEALMRERHHITRPEDQDFVVRMAQQVVSVMGKSAHTLAVFLSLVAVISLLVSGVVIMNIMLISVSERTREIGLRRAVGATRRDILRQFRTEALLVTLSGGVIGLVLGMAVSSVLPLVSKIHTAASWQTAVLAAVLSVAVGLVFGLRPARRAAEMSPVEALRAG